MSTTSYLSQGLVWFYGQIFPQTGIFDEEIKIISEEDMASFKNELASIKEKNVSSRKENRDDLKTYKEEYMAQSKAIRHECRTQAKIQIDEYKVQLMSMRGQK